MKNATLAAFALLLISVATFASPTPSPAPLSDAALAAILNAPVGGAACAKAQPAARIGKVPAFKSDCSATANCQAGGTVSCNGSSTCTAVDGNCSDFLEAGHVTCNGVTTTCTPACCTTGTQHDKQCCRCDATGDCFDCCRCAGGGAGQCAFQCG